MERAEKTGGSLRTRGMVYINIGNRRDGSVQVGKKVPNVWWEVVPWSAGNQPA